MTIEIIKEQLGGIWMLLKPKEFEADEKKPYSLLLAYQNFLNKENSLEHLQSLCERYQLIQEKIQSTDRLLQEEEKEDPSIDSLFAAFQLDPSKVPQLRATLLQLEAQYILNYTEILIKKCQWFVNDKTNDIFTVTLNDIRGHLNRLFEMVNTQPELLDTNVLHRDFEMYTQQLQQLETSYNYQQTVVPAMNVNDTRKPLNPNAPEFTPDNRYSFYTKMNVNGDDVARQLHYLSLQS